jgi:hypothetical protein
VGQASNIIGKSLVKAFSTATIEPIVNKAGALAQNRILQRTQKGQFLGGAGQSKPYSSNPIYAWKLGKTTWNSSDKSLRIKKRLVSPVIVDSNELKWTNKGAILLGGYRRFRQLSGLNTTNVDLSFTGRMLSSLQYKTTLFKGFARITLTVPRSQQAKAFYTDRNREWLGLNEREIDQVQKYITNQLDMGLK